MPTQRRTYWRSTQLAHSSTLAAQARLRRETEAKVRSESAAKESATRREAAVAEVASSRAAAAREAVEAQAAAAAAVRAVGELEASLRADRRLGVGGVGGGGGGGGHMVWPLRPASCSLVQGGRARSRQQPLTALQRC